MPTFVPPPESLFRRRPMIDPGVVALLGGIAAVLLMAAVLFVAFR